MPAPASQARPPRPRSPSRHPLPCVPLPPPLRPVSPLPCVARLTRAAAPRARRAPPSPSRRFPARALGAGKGVCGAGGGSSRTGTAAAARSQRTCVRDTELEKLPRRRRGAGGPAPPRPTAAAARRLRTCAVVGVLELHVGHVLLPVQRPGTRGAHAPQDRRVHAQTQVGANARHDNAMPQRDSGIHAVRRGPVPA